MDFRSGTDSPCDPGVVSRLVAVVGDVVEIRGIRRGDVAIGKAHVDLVGAVPGLKKEAAGLLDDSRAAILSLALWVGPEGGFSSEEEAALLRIGCQPLTLGQAIMRVETAVPALFGMIQGLLQSRV